MSPPFQTDIPDLSSELSELLTLSNKGLAKVDPVVMNLLVAKGIRSLAQLDIPRYQKMCDDGAQNVERLCASRESRFWAAPHKWKNDIRFFRLVVLAEYTDVQMGIRYREDQKDLKKVYYTDPADLFLNGVLDTRRGTCGNMAALLVAIGWRLGWPVSLACVGSHLICRFDDAQVTHNIETTNVSERGIQSHSDEYYFEEENLLRIAVACGSDLRALRPREMLGVFLGLRARYFNNRQEYGLAESDYLLARWLFPTNRHLWREQIGNSKCMAMFLFEENERGHPIHFAREMHETAKAGVEGLALEAGVQVSW